MYAQWSCKLYRRYLAYLLIPVKNNHKFIVLIYVFKSVTYCHENERMNLWEILQLSKIEELLFYCRECCIVMDML